MRKRYVLSEIFRTSIAYDDLPKYQLAMKAGLQGGQLTQMLKGQFFGPIVKARLEPLGAFYSIPVEDQTVEWSQDMAFTDDAK